MPTVRELVTELGFKVNTAGLREYDRHVGRVVKSTKNLLQNTRTVATGLRNVGRDLSLFVSGPLAALSIFSIKQASNLERLRIKFETLTGSAEKAKNLIDELIRISRETPFDIRDVQAATTRLLAMGVPLEDVIEQVNSLGNIAAATEVHIGRLITAFGQVHTAKILKRTELRQFTEAGVDLIQLLADLKNLDPKTVDELITARKISFEDVAQALRMATSEGGKFFNLNRKIAKTTAGRFVNMVEAAALLSAEFGKIFEETLNLKGVFAFLTVAMDKLIKKMKNTPGPVKVIITTLTVLTIVIPPLLFALGMLGLAFVGLVKGIAAFKAALLLFAGSGGIAVLIKGLAILGIKILAIIALFGIFVDELTAWMNGGRSIIGLFLGDFETFVDNMKMLLKDLKDGFKAVFQGEMQKAAKSLDKFNARFGRGFNKISRNTANVLKKTFEGNVITERIGEGIINTGIGLKATATRSAGLVQNIAEATGDFIGTNRPPGQGSGFSDLFPRVPASQASDRSVTVNSNINVTVPEGTSQEQANFVEQKFQNVIRKEFDRHFSSTIIANPVVE